MANLPQGISVFDEDLRLRVWNAGFVDVPNLPTTAIYDSAYFSDLIRIPATRGEYGPGEPRVIVATLMERAQKREPHHIQRTHPNGKTLDIRGAPLVDGGFVTIYTDVTERRESAEREQLAQKVFSHTPTGIIFTDDVHRILSINPATTQMTGYESNELLGHSVFALIKQEHGQTPETIQEDVAHQGTWSSKLEVTRKNGDTLAAGLRVSRVDDAYSGLPAHYIWILADITERKQAEVRMRHIAQHDALTGLPNRLALTMRLAQLLPEARRHHWRLAIMFIDLDRFKIINDKLGHQIGDELLREGACRLSSVIRETDFVTRLSGD